MFDKLKSLFIEEDESVSKTDADAQGESTTNKSSGSQGSHSHLKVNKETYIPSSDGKPNEKFINMLMGALEKNNEEGFDYLEFKQALQNLNNVQMDESTRYKSAMAMATTMGATSQKLQSSANNYIKVLNEEERKFLEAFENQQNAKVNAQNSEIQTLEKSIHEKTMAIERFKKEIEADKKILEDKKSRIDHAKARVSATKDGFYIAYNIVINQIKQDLVNIKNYIQG